MTNCYYVFTRRPAVLFKRLLCFIDPSLHFADGYHLHGLYWTFSIY